MILSIVFSFSVAGGPHLYGFWMLPDPTPLRVSFDPASNPSNLVISAAYSSSFRIFNDAYVGAGYRGLSASLETRFAQLEGEYNGTANEVSATLGYTHSIFEGFRLGASFSYYQLNTPRSDISRLQALGVHLSSLFTVYDRWNVGLFARNLNAPEMGGIPLPSLFGGYISFIPKAGIRTAVGVYKDQYSDLSFGIGGSWLLYDILTIKGSMRYDGQFPTFYAGFVLSTPFVSPDVTVTVHPELPVSTYMSFNYVRP